MPPLLLSEMADSYTCKGGRKTAGSNKPAASKESRTETRINAPAELPKLGKELGFSFHGGVDGAEGTSPVAGVGRQLPKQGGVIASDHGMPLLLTSTHRRGLCWAKKAPGPRSCREPVPGNGRGGMETVSPFREVCVWLNEMGVSLPIYRVGG